MINPRTQRFVRPEGVSNAKSEVARICVDKARADSAVSTVAVDERQLWFAHFPDLLHQIGEESSVDDRRGMESVKIDLHLLRPWIRTRFQTNPIVDCFSQPLLAA